MIIGISGKIGAGKDECFKQLKRAGIDCVRLSLAVPIKEMAVKYWGYNKKQIREKPPEVRSTLQILGLLMREEVDPSYWTEQLSKLIHADKDLKKRVDSKKKHIVITDVRYPDDVRLVRGELLGIHIRVEREDEDIKLPSKGYGKKQFAAKAENALDGVKVDYTVQNNGSKKELREQLVNVLKQKYARASRSTRMILNSMDR